MKVLIVEDNLEDRKLLRINLEHHGYSVIEASNGEDALELAVNKKPDLIISDILMPKMDGFELLWNLKQNETTKNIPFIYYSAVYTGQRDKNLAIALGAEAFIEKPSEPETFWKRLTETINSYLSNKSARMPDMELLIKEEEFFKNYSKIIASKLDEKVKELYKEKEKFKELSIKFRTLLDTIPDFIILLSPELKIIWTNNASSKMFNKTNDELEGKYCYNVLLNRTEPCESCPAQRVLRSFGVETERIKTSDGKILDIRAAPVMEDKGQITAIIEIARDITEQIKTQEELLQAQKMESIGLLAGGIAHDLNNMLQPIIGFAQILTMNLDKSSFLYKYAENILSSANRAKNLVQGILAFSRKQILDLKPIIIDEIILNLSKILSRVIGEDIELKLNLNAKDILVMADSVQIQQILMNLATNSRDAMPKGGLFSITTELVEIDENFIRIHGYGEKGKYLLITVSDTGEGMDKETMERIFEPFFTTKPVGKGTGLGLSIVYGIVKQHSGYIDVDSKKGEGTTFRLYLPIVKECGVIKKEEELNEESLIKGKGETILIIEDEEIVRNFIRTFLEDSDYRVIEARNGKDALEKFIENKDKVKLIVLDVMLPIKNGKQVAEEIKSIAPDIKVLFMSGYPSDIIHIKGINQKDINFISKPFHPQLFLRKVKELLS